MLFFIPRSFRRALRWLILGFLLETVILCHIVWLGCLEENTILTDRFTTQSTVPQVAKGAGIRAPLARSLAEHVDLGRQLLSKGIEIPRGTKQLACPVLPKPLSSVFHREWFYYAADVPNAALQFYKSLKKTPVLRDRAMQVAVVATVAEWIGILYILLRLGYKLLAKGLLKLIVAIYVSLGLIQGFHVVSVLFGIHWLPTDLRASILTVLTSLSHYFKSVLLRVVPVIFEFLQSVWESDTLRRLLRVAASSAGLHTEL